MATDQTPPKNNVIFILGAASLVTLVLFQFGFNSYFAHSRVEQERQHFVVPSGLQESRREAERALRTGPLSIEQAIAKLGEVSRSSLEPVRPEASAETGPLQGWAQLPPQMPPAPLLPRPVAPADSTVSEADGGAAPAAVDAEGRP